MTVPTGRRRPNAMLVRRWFLHHGFYRRQVAPPPVACWTRGRPMIASRPQMDPSPLSLSVSVERWPIAGAFTISRGAKTEASWWSPSSRRHASRAAANACPMRATARRSRASRPQSRRCGAQSPDGFDRAAPPIRHGARRSAQRARLRVLGPGRQARQRPVHELAGLAVPKPLTTAYTISLGTPDAMAQAAAKAADRRCSRSSSAAARRSRANRFGPQCRTAGAS